MKVSYFRLLMMICCVLILTLFPLPGSLVNLRPLWVMLVLLYIQCMLPDLFHYIWVVLLGLMLDVLFVAPLGEHMFALCVVAGFVSSRARRFKFFTQPQQMIWVFCLTTIYQIILAIIHYVLGHSTDVMQFITPIITSVLVWPLVIFLMDFLLRIKQRAHF